MVAQVKTLMLCAIWCGVLIHVSLGSDSEDLVISTHEDVTQYIEPFTDRRRSVLNMCSRYRCNNLCGTEVFTGPLNWPRTRRMCACDSKCPFYNDCCWDFWDVCPREVRQFRLFPHVRPRAVCVGYNLVLAYDRLLPSGNNADRSNCADGSYIPYSSSSTCRSELRLNWKGLINFLETEARPVSSPWTGESYRSAEDFALIRPDISYRSAVIKTLARWEPILIATQKPDISTLTDFVQGKYPSTLDIFPTFWPRNIPLKDDRRCMKSTWLKCSNRGRLEMSNITRVCEYFFNPSGVRNVTYTPEEGLGVTTVETSSLSSTGASSTTSLPFREKNPIKHASETLNTRNSVEFGVDLDKKVTNTTIDQDNNAGSTETTTQPSRYLTDENCSEDSSSNSERFILQYTVDSLSNGNPREGIAVVPWLQNSLWSSIECRPVKPRDDEEVRTTETDTYCDIHVNCLPGWFYVNGTCDLPYMVLLQINSAQDVTRAEFNTNLRRFHNFLGYLEGIWHGEELTPDNVSCIVEQTSAGGNNVIKYYGVYYLKRISITGQLPGLTRLQMALTFPLTSDGIRRKELIDNVRACYVMLGQNVDVRGRDGKVTGLGDSPKKQTSHLVEAEENITVEDMETCNQKPWSFKGNVAIQRPDFLCEDITPRTVAPIPRLDINPCKGNTTCKNKTTVSIGNVLNTTTDCLFANATACKNKTTVSIGNVLNTTTDCLFANVTACKNETTVISKVDGPNTTTDCPFTNDTACKNETIVSKENGLNLTDCLFANVTTCKNETTLSTGSGFNTASCLFASVPIFVLNALVVTFKF